MEPATNSFAQIAANSKDFARLLLTVGQNRLELLAGDLQEERERLLQAMLLALGVAALGLLACVTLTAAIVFLMRPYPPEFTLLVLTCIYGAAAFYLGQRLVVRLRDWQVLSSSLDQLRKDCAVRETTPP